MEKFLKNIRIEGDRVVWGVVLLLSLLSLLAVYSGAAKLAFAPKGSGNVEYFLVKQFVTLVAGFGIMYVVHQIPSAYFKGLSQIFFWLAIPLLLITLIPGVGIEKNEARRWLPVPGGLEFQTSDFAKLALVMYLARLLSKKQEVIKDFRTGYLPVIAAVGVICGLILPANFSTAALLFSTCIVIMFIGRVKLKYIAATIGLFVVAFGLFVLVSQALGMKGRTQVWANRAKSFVGMDTGEAKQSDLQFQGDMAKMAIATGGILGKGPGGSSQRANLPQVESDFIFALIVEEYGFIGGLVVILLYLILLFRGIKIAYNAQGSFETLLAVGLCFMLVFQAMINIAVAVGLFPVTGQTLPLISWGTTSFFFTSVSIGVILSISRKKEEMAQTEATDKKGGNYAMA